MKLFTFGILILLAIFACIAVEASPSRNVSGNLLLGGVTNGLPLWSGHTSNGGGGLGSNTSNSLMVGGNLHVDKAVGPLNLSLGFNHAFYRKNGYWIDRNFWSVGGDIDLSKSTALFVDYRNRYGVGEDFCWVGIKFRFGNTPPGG